MKTTPYTIKYNSTIMKIIQNSLLNFNVFFYMFFRVAKGYNTGTPRLFDPNKKLQHSLPT